MCMCFVFERRSDQSREIPVKDTGKNHTLSALGETFLNLASVIIYIYI